MFFVFLFLISALIKNPLIRFIKCLFSFVKPKKNIKTIDSCATRLRLEVVEENKVDTSALKALGARGVLTATGGSVQVVIGPEVEQICDEIKQLL